MQETELEDYMMEDLSQVQKLPSSYSTMNGRETHKQKMERKRKRREMAYKSTPSPLILANISVNHMDYGMSPAEHLRAKQERKNNS
jgi:hypothetical protein